MDEKVYSTNLSLKDWIEAGKLTSEVIKIAKKLIDNGVSVVDVVEKIESKFNLAFPLNISMDQIAAHDTADVNDERIFEGVVKVDVGIEVNGAIGDAAITIDLTDKHEELLNANKESLEEVINIIRKQFQEKRYVDVDSIGQTIENIKNKYKKGIVKNLTGHGLGINQVHTEPSIYNYNAKTNIKIKPDFAFAIEPFFTYQDAIVKNYGNPKIFQLVSLKPIRDSFSRKVLNFISKNYSTKPFSKRWIYNEFGERSLFSLMNLWKNGNLYAYPPLKATSDPVSQFEHTVVISDKVYVTTQGNKEE